MGGDGYLSGIGASLSAPASGLTWTQLAAATVFVVVVLVAWRQVVQLIMREL